MRTGLGLFILLSLIWGNALAQKDSVLIFYKDTVFINRGKAIDWEIVHKHQQNLTFTGTRIAQPPSDKYDSTGTISLSGYISCYYGVYSDTSNATGFQKFPTSAPKTETFSLNIVQLSAAYTSRNVRGIFTFHYGDIPHCAWSNEYNLIQEANIGMRIAKKLWVDAGLFRTHIGLESIQPRENITYSVATTTYYEPYFLSGAKLTWNASSKLTLQANVFNSFNTFHETNKNKAFGLAALYEFSPKLSITFNTIHCDESPVYATLKQPRIYNNLYLVYKSKRIDLGAEANFGTQQHTKLSDSTQSAIMYSALLAVKLKITPKQAVYSRVEYFYDPDEILTGPVQNGHHQLVGINLLGITAGMEVKPIINSYFRIEGRYLQTTSDEDIFLLNGRSSHQRWEIITGIGVWF